MKKTLITSATILTILIVAGCQQVKDLQDSTQKVVTDTTEKVEDISNRAMETKAAVEEKLNQAQQAADAINKLTK